MPLWGLCLEASWALAASKLRTSFLPFRYWAWPHGRFQSETFPEPRAADLERIHRVRNVIKRLGRFTPWRSKCLDQALAVQRLLARRGMGSTMYYGMRRDGGTWIAHAWVRCGDQRAIGYLPDADYTVVGTCSLHPPLKGGPNPSPSNRQGPGR
jgi:hypothetical protein